MDSDVKDIPGASEHFFSRTILLPTGALNIFKNTFYMS